MLLRKKIANLPIDIEYFMSLLSGMEAGLATTAAIVAGLATGTDDRQIVLTTALVTMTVQAFNSAANRLSTEHTVDELENNPDHKSYTKPAIDAGAQFGAHIIASFIILLPLIFVTDLDKALIFTISLTLFLLFALGFIKGHFVKKFQFRDAMEALILGALVISVGLTAGLAINFV